VTLVDDLDRFVTTGALTRTGMVNADMYSFTGPLGEYGGEAFTVAVSVFAYDNGTIRTHGETWLGEHRVLLPPLEANWPAVKAMRELDADPDDVDNVTRRLLAAVIPRNAVPVGLGFQPFT
jgi:hypothetical protein